MTATIPESGFCSFRSGRISGVWERTQRLGEIRDKGDTRLAFMEAASALMSEPGLDTRYCWL